MSEQAAANNLRGAINVRLAMLGAPVVETELSAAWTAITQPLFTRQREIRREMSPTHCPPDNRIQEFLNDYLSKSGVVPQLPYQTFVLDQPGIARELSLPVNGDTFESPLVKSYRLHNGILHNPASDRRTTQGVFHIAEGGFSVPDDKLAVPRETFARLLDLALLPPKELLRLPYTAGQKNQAHCFVSLYLRPIVVPAIPGQCAEKRMEIRFFAPASLVSNLDFVEGIFGNAGDPYLPENDAALDTDGWTGHTGCVILAPHLTGAVKHQVGLPHWDIATERQRRDGMCWKNRDELYNDGKPFKICARTPAGGIVTIIADNYYGYCKKEVKTQISFAANLHGSAEEEHAGGALVFPSFNLGNDYTYKNDDNDTTTPADLLAREPDRYEPQPEGHLLDKLLPNTLVVPLNARFNLPNQTITWKNPDNTEAHLHLLANKTYFLPNGYRVHMEPVEGERGLWRMIGINPEPTFCHKPSTVSGGGKSEISKAISDAILPGHVFVADFENDFRQVADLLARDYSNRFREPVLGPPDHRPLLSPQRSIGSVVKLLSPSRSEYNDAYNDFLRQIPAHIKELVFIIKRYYKPEWGDDWRTHFSVDMINGRPANELKIDGKKLVVSTLRVGYETDGSWRVFSLRPDFHPAAKVQMEDDITASAVIPAATIKGKIPTHPETEYATNPGSYKFVQNCENLLFQRPDDAIKRGYDKQAEADIATPGTFVSNYEPLTAADARAIIEDAVNYSAYTKPMKDLIRQAAAQSDDKSPRYFVTTSHPRLINGKPSKNTRYLQRRPDHSNPHSVQLAHNSIRYHRRLTAADPVLTPVNTVVPGRRNNPPEPGVNPLCVFSPLHYLELPELFMEYISSMTGKSPSTTGAGSEGALTKGPFNALPSIIDLNAALTSLILTEHNVFLSAAGYVGPKARVDHDISLLIPEVFSRMEPELLSPRRLIEHNYLERLQDFEHKGRKVLASRLGYRITSRFARIYFGRVFTHPHTIFTDEMLRPETQDMDIFADSMDNIVTTHKRVAESYFTDNGIDLACPPLRALLHIMADGHYESETLDSPNIRQLFTKKNMLASNWYGERLDAKQNNDAHLCERHLRTLGKIIENPHYADVTQRFALKEHHQKLRRQLTAIQSPAYRESLTGTIGTQPL